MSTFNRNSRDSRSSGPRSGGRSFGGKPSFGGRSSFGGKSSFNRGGSRNGSDRPTLYDAVCSTCGDECKVPFQPTGSKPVFCRSCFENNGGKEAADKRKEERRGSEGRGFESRGADRRDSRRPAFGGKKEFGNRNSDSRNFDNKSNAHGESTKELKEQLNAMNAKLDQILRSMKPAEKSEKQAVTPLANLEVFAKKSAKVEKPAKTEKSVKAEKPAKKAKVADEVTSN